MILFEILVHILLYLFLLYTAVYIAQWLLGLCISVLRLSRIREEHQVAVAAISPADARELPVTVLIPAHNEEARILSTIESLRSCGYPNLRIIAVDDGSTDDTARKVLQAYGLEEFTPEAKDFSLDTEPVLAVYRQPKDDSLMLIRKKNGGKADALNCGLNYCRSKHCVILDADTQIEKGAIHVMVSKFLADRDMVVCAGSVGTYAHMYPRLTFPRKALVLFQTLEYFRTFYMQRILLDRVNANIVVSGAFAMFDAELIRECGGYSGHTIGEDMELTMRIHAFCSSQRRPYRISYTPAARCHTQFPFRWRDYYRQRRRWQIGMIQSMRRHRYMCGNLYYGWAGLISGTIYCFYELYSPFVELMGLFTLACAYGIGILNLSFAVSALLIYLLILLLTQALLIAGINQFGVEPLPLRMQLLFALVSLGEFLVYHFISTATKLFSFLTLRRKGNTWGQIKRSENTKASSR